MEAMAAREAGGVTSTEIVLASACLDLNAAREGYNFVQLFSPGRSDIYENDDNGNFQQERSGQGEMVDEEEHRLMGQFVVKLEWAEVGQEGLEEEEARGHTVLVVQGASGLAKSDS